MNKLQITLSTLILMLLLGACNKVDVKLKVKNNSKHAIAFDCSLDTVLDAESYDINIFIRDKIDPGVISTQIKPGDTKGWQSLIESSKNKKLNAFIIEIDTLLKYNDWEYIRKNKLYKRYELTEEELNKKNWIIDYP